MNRLHKKRKKTWNTRTEKVDDDESHNYYYYSGERGKKNRVSGGGAETLLDARATGKSVRPPSWHTVRRETPVSARDPRDKRYIIIIVVDRRVCVLRVCVVVRRAECLALEIPVRIADIIIIINTCVRHVRDRLKTTHDSSLSLRPINDRPTRNNR